MILRVKYRNAVHEIDMPPQTATGYAAKRVAEHFELDPELVISDQIPVILEQEVYLSWPDTR